MSQERYARQLNLAEIGEAGQSALADSSVTIIGCGGLGNLAATYLAGAGVGRLRLVDGDKIEVSNLHRQILYREDDIGRPKAEALADAIRSRNSDVETIPEVSYATARKLPKMLEGADLVLDCCDNFPTRYLVNAACIESQTALVSAAAIRLEGLLLNLRPGTENNACYQCVFPHDPDAGGGETCQEAGVLGPSVGVMASLQATQAITILTGRGQFNRMWRWDAHSGEVRRLSLTPDTNCPACSAKPT